LEIPLETTNYVTSSIAFASDAQHEGTKLVATAFRHDWFRLSACIKAPMKVGSCHWHRTDVGLTIQHV
jgi:hypothetical protein